MSVDSSSATRHDLDARLERIESLLLSQPANGEVHVLDLMRALWRFKWLIAIVTAAFAIASIVLAFVLPVEYTATALLVPAEDTSSSKLSQLAQDFGGLAGLGGVQLPQSEDRSAEAIKVLKSWGFLADFIRENNIAVDVLAATGWDRAQNELYIDPHVYDVKNHKWVKKFDSAAGEAGAPNGWDLYRAFRHRLSVEQDKTTGLITIGVEYYSPVLAKEWVTGLVSAINEQFRLQDRAQAQLRLEYLGRQLQQTKIQDMRTELDNLVGNEMQTLMLTEVDREYVLKTVSAARVPEHRSSPPRLLICIGGPVLGAVLSILFLIIRDAALRTRNNALEG